MSDLSYRCGECRHASVCDEQRSCVGWSVPAGAGGVDREAIRARCEAATPGPWHVEESTWDIPGTTEVDRIVCGPTPTAGAPRDGIADVFDGHWVDGVEDRGPAPNLEFIAHAREDVPALLAALGVAEAKVRAVEEELAEWDRAVEPDGSPAFMPVRGGAAVLRARIALASHDRSRVTGN